MLVWLAVALQTVQAVPPPSPGLLDPSSPDVGTPAVTSTVYTARCGDQAVSVRPRAPQWVDVSVGDQSRTLDGWAYQKFAGSSLRTASVECLPDGRVRIAFLWLTSSAGAVFGYRSSLVLDDQARVLQEGPIASALPAQVAQWMEDE